MNNIKQAVILAGGKGTRLQPFTNKLPKPMIQFYNKPFLEYLVEMLKQNGIKEIILLLGYLPEKVIQYFSDGSKFGLKIKYSIGDIDWDTGKRIKKAKKLLDNYFLLLYCDNYWPLNLNKLINFYCQNKTLGMVTVSSNLDKITKNNMLVDKKGFVIKYDKSRRNNNLNGVEIGFYLLNKKILKLMPKDNFCFEKEILPKLIKKQQLRGYLTDHRYYSISTLKRLPLTKKFLKVKKIIFLDRDGVLNKKPLKGEYVCKWSNFRWLPGTKKALRLLKKAGYEVIIITNQAGIARGLMTEKDLKKIHQKMKKEIKDNGGEIKNIYYCPHDWNDGCECRKPKPGMLLQASRDFYLDLTKTIFIGDDESDYKAGNDAGCHSVLVTPKNNLLKIVKTLLSVNKN